MCHYAWLREVFKLLIVPPPSPNVTGLLPQASDSKSHANIRSLVQARRKSMGEASGVGWGCSEARLEGVKSKNQQ